MKREKYLEISQLLILAFLFAEPTERVYIAQVLIPTLCILSAKCPLEQRFFFLQKSNSRQPKWPLYKNALDRPN